MATDSVRSLIVSRRIHTRSSPGCPTDWFGPVSERQPPPFDREKTVSARSEPGFEPGSSSSSLLSDATWASLTYRLDCFKGLTGYLHFVLYQKNYSASTARKLFRLAVNQDSNLDPPAHRSSAMPPELAWLIAWIVLRGWLATYILYYTKKIRVLRPHCCAVCGDGDSSFSLGGRLKTIKVQSSFSYGSNSLHVASLDLFIFADERVNWQFESSWSETATKNGIYHRGTGIRSL